MLKNRITYNKPLKGMVLDLSAANIGDLKSTNLLITPSNVESLIQNTSLTNITIEDSQLKNCRIGTEIPNEAYFTYLTTYNDVTFLSDNGNQFKWNSTSGILTINGGLSVTGCVTLGNIQICGNTISAINGDGDIILKPNGNGVISIGYNTNTYLKNTQMDNNIYDTHVLNSGDTWNNNNSDTFLLNANNHITLNASNDIYLNGSSIYMRDANPLIGNFEQDVNNNTDRGIQFNYWSNNRARLGWFGFKNTTKKFTFLQNATNNNDIITGDSSAFDIGSINVNNITLNSSGILDMACGSLINVTNIESCNNGIINMKAINTLNISSGNINVSTTKIQIPYNSLLTFGGQHNSITMDTSSNMIFTVNSGTGTVVFNSNVTINGITNTVFSTVTTYTDPILSIGGVTGAVSNDIRDRGIEFKWYNDNDEEETGFFGFKNDTKRFVFYAQDTNTDEIISGTLGDVEFSKGYYSNLDVNCGTISNIALLTGCNNTINISSSNVLLNNNSDILFGNTSVSIKATNGNLQIYGDLQINGDTVIEESISMKNKLNYSVEHITVSALLTVNPDISKIITYLVIQGNAVGTLGSLNVSDGQVKKIICESCSGTYHLTVTNLIAPNPLNGTPATGILFKRAGMSCELIWNASLNSWIISGGLAYTF